MSNDWLEACKTAEQADDTKKNLKLNENLVAFWEENFPDDTPMETHINELIRTNQYDPDIKEYFENYPVRIMLNQAQLIQLEKK